jgi:hypothetical protein
MSYLTPATGGSGAVSFGRDAAETVYLLVENYAAFMRNDRVMWYSELLVGRDHQIKARSVALRFLLSQQFISRYCVSIF